MTKKIIRLTEEDLHNIVENSVRVILDEYSSHDDNMLLEMANLSQNKTGLDCIVWVQTKLPGNHGQHNIPRLKVQYNDTLIPISISKEQQILIQYQIPSKILKPICEWIVLNYENLISLWNGAITTDEFIDNINKI